MIIPHICRNMMKENNIIVRLDGSDQNKTYRTKITDGTNDLVQIESNDGLFHFSNAVIGTRYTIIVEAISDGVWSEASHPVSFIFSNQACVEREVNIPISAGAKQDKKSPIEV